MKKRFTALLLSLVLLLTGCGIVNSDETSQNGTNPNNSETEAPGEVTDLGDDNKTFGDSLDDLGVYDGYFENASTDIEIKCISGTDKAYKLEDTRLTFTKIDKETVYSISGTFRGNIVIDVGDNYKFDLELHGLSLVCNSVNPITIKSGDEVAIKAKKDTKNYIYDMRAAVDSDSSPARSTQTLILKSVARVR